MDYGIANQQGQVSSNEAEAILQYAQKSGIDTLDTAILYGDSEQRLGEIGLRNWQVITKLPAVPEGCNDISKWVQNTVKESLKRLKMIKLYGLLLHYPQQLLGCSGDKLYQVLQKLKCDGLVKNIGISIYDPSELDELCGLYRFDIVQAPFNILDRRLINSSWLSRLSEQGIELHVRSIFLQGLLLMSSEIRPVQFNRWKTVWSEWDKWLDKTGLTPSEACIRYALSFSEITKVIIGVDSLRQLNEVLHSAQGKLPVVPPELVCSDTDLINPSRWGK